MSARYLVRFDDICDTMNWSVWDRVEGILDRHGVKPILAVVPDNKDAELVVQQRAKDFWGRARRWQAKGYSIAVHGYQHLFSSTSSGLIGLHERSEFAGLPRDVQWARLQASLNIFREQAVTPTLWVAPAHSFDEVTVELLRLLSIWVVSDGFFFSAAKDPQGTTWLPQQLWRFRKFPAGLWTVCLHVNSWDEDAIDKFDKSLAALSARFTTVEGELGRLHGSRRRSPDWMIHKLLLGVLRIKQFVVGMVARRVPG